MSSTSTLTTDKVAVTANTTASSPRNKSKKAEDDKKKKSKNDKDKELSSSKQKKKTTKNMEEEKDEEESTEPAKKHSKSTGEGKSSPATLVTSTALPKKPDELCEVMLEGVWWPGRTVSVPKGKKRPEFRVQLLELDEHVEAFDVRKDHIRCLPTRPGHEDDEIQLDREYTALFPEDGNYHPVVVKVIYVFTSRLSKL